MKCSAYSEVINLCKNQGLTFSEAMNHLQETHHQVGIIEANISHIPYIILKGDKLDTDYFIQIIKEGGNKIEPIDIKIPHHGEDHPLENYHVFAANHSQLYNLCKAINWLNNH